MTRILIADDVSENRYLLIALLEGHGYEVVPAVNGAEALSLAQTSPPDLIITDILMPVMDGFDLCRRWKQDERLKGIPFVIYTATYTDPKDEHLALGLGADRFLIKPQKVEVLLEVVRELLEEAGRDRGAEHSEAARDEMELLRLHNEALFRKLQKRVLQLEDEIARRDQVEAALQESERRFRLLAENSLDVVWCMGFDSRLSYVSPAVERLQGYAPAEVLKVPPEKFLGPEALQQLQETLGPILADLAAGRTPDWSGLFELQQPCKDGSTVWTEVSAGIMRDDSGRAIGIQGVSRDITRRRQAEDELRRTTAFLDSIIEHIPDMVFLKDARELRFVRFNRAGEALLGHSRTELLGKNDYDLFPRDQADFFAQKDREVLRRKEVVDIPEEPLRTRDKGERIVHTKKVPVLNANGEPEFLLGISEDITERKRTEAALQEGAGLMRIAGRMARLGGWSVNLADMRVLWSDEVAAIHEVPVGHSPSVEEGIGFYAPEWRTRIAELFGGCARDGTSYDDEMEIITARGNRVWVRTIGEAIRDASGAITKVQGAFQDITDRKQAEEERRELQNQLLQSQKLESIGRLAGGVAHDFNNLMSVVLCYAGFAIETVREGDPLHADLEEIRKAGSRAAALTRQLLAFSRKQLLEPDVLNLSKVVAGIEGMLRRLLGEDIDIEVLLAEDLGSVMADPGQIEQVIMNLAVNARDAMPQGGKLTIETDNVELDENYADQHVAVKPGRFVQLSVTDSGGGMDAATREHIFEPFFTTKDKGKGTGLGLSTVYGIVTQSGGSIWVYSEPGRGTTFKVYLPRVDAAAAEITRRSVSVMATGSETVLIVEDEEAVRRIAGRILRRAGYRVQSASNGGEALLMCEKLGGEIDLLLTDVVMPQMSGRELTERLTPRCPRLKTLYMSGYTDDAIAHNGVLEPGTRFIGKPFAAGELTRKVREALDAE